MYTHLSKKPLYIVLFSFFSCVLSVWGGTLYAQEGLALKVQPSVVDELMDPGQTATGAITVTNQSGGEQTYYIGTRNIISVSETGTPSFSDTPSTDRLEAASWIESEVESIVLAEGSSRQVPYTIRVPSDASPGTHLAAIMVSREADVVTESGAGVGFQVASLVILRVSGPVNEDMIFRSFSTKDKSFFVEPSVLFEARVDNTGTIHQRPTGIISIFDMFGNEVGHITFNDSGGAVMPRNPRVFETEWNYDGFALGKYTAKASLVFGESSKTTRTREVTFWVVPLKEVGIVFVGIVAFLLALMLSIRSYVRRMLKKAGHSTLPKREKDNVSLAKRMVRTIVWLLGILTILFIGMIVFFSG